MDGCNAGIPKVQIRLCRPTWQTETWPTALTTQTKNLMTTTNFIHTILPSKRFFRLFRIKNRTAKSETQNVHKNSNLAARQKIRYQQIEERVPLATKMLLVTNQYSRFTFWNLCRYLKKKLIFPKSKNNLWRNIQHFFIRNSETNDLKPTVSIGRKSEN